MSSVGSKNHAIVLESVLCRQKNGVSFFGFAEKVVPLAAPKVLTLEKTQARLVFCSLNRTFAYHAEVLLFVCYKMKDSNYA